jgi:hypothetical protein
MEIRTHARHDHLNLAVEHSVLEGMWSLFVHRDFVLQVWRGMVEDGEAGMLGQIAEVSPAPSLHDHLRICVFMPRFKDRGNVARIGEAMSDLSLGRHCSRPIVYFKIEALNRYLPRYLRYPKHSTFPSKCSPSLDYELCFCGACCLIFSLTPSLPPCSFALCLATSSGPFPASP